MADLDTPQFDLPFRLTDDGAAEVEQDSSEEVTDCVETLLRTRLGSVEENPDYGISDPTFEEGGVDLDEIQTAIGQWEPRADTMLEENPDLLDRFVSRVTLKTRVRSDA